LFYKLSLFDLPEHYLHNINYSYTMIRLTVTNNMP